MPSKRLRHPGIADRKGFTLAELVVVVSLVGLVATLVIINVGGAATGAREKVACQELRDIYKAVMGDERSITGFYHETRTDFKIPPSIHLLCDKAYMAEFLGVPEESLGWDENHRRGYRPGGYLKAEGMLPGSTHFTLLDPWGNPYVIQKPGGEDDEARVVSAGPNGQIDIPEFLRKEEIIPETYDDLFLHFKK